jgi:hypothetical protein
MKKTLMIIMLLSGLFLVGCGVKPSWVANDDSTATDVWWMTCYEECKMYGWWEETIKMCEENCDASYKRAEIDKNYK